MGFLSKIKKAVKKVFKGVKKVFKKAVKFVGKIASSKWGKALMLAAAIYTGGMALTGGWDTFMTTQGSFLDKFVAGSKTFMGSLTGATAGAGNTATGIASAGAEAASGIAGTGTAALAGNGASALNVAGSASGLLGGTSQAAGMTGGLLSGGAQALSAAAPTALTAASAPAASGGWLAKGAKMAWDAANSPIGSKLISGALEGYQEGKAQEVQNERDDQRLYGTQADINAMQQLPQGFGQFAPQV
jgi:hypothetical protein